jgi:hypothetical protein
MLKVVSTFASRSDEYYSFTMVDLSIPWNACGRETAGGGASAVQNATFIFASHVCLN